MTFRGYFALNGTELVNSSRVVGHLALSPVTIDGANAGWFGLGPVAVAPDAQAMGVGSALIRAVWVRVNQLPAV